MVDRLRFVILTMTLVVAGCSGGDGDDRSDGDPGGATTSTSQPAPATVASSEVTSTTLGGVDLDRLAVDLQGLLDRYDQAVAAILADPSVATDPEHDAVREYRALFVPGGSFADSALRSWAGMAGRYYRPGPEGRMFRSTVGDVAVGADAEVATFKVCLWRSIEIVDGEGQPVSAEAGWNAAEGAAELVGGGWRLRDLTQVPPESCDQEGGGG